MDLSHVAILAIVEGFTEFLPISSTGHLILTSYLLGIGQTPFMKTFEIIIQLGAILAVIFLYWRKLKRSYILWKKIFIAFLPTAIIGFTLYRIVKDILLGNPLITLGAIFLGGIILIILELLYKEKEYHVQNVEEITYKQSVLIGLFQSLSLIPGVSRAAATIIGALFLGAKRKSAVEFSFFLAVPTMITASTFEIIQSSFSLTTSEIQYLLIGFILSFFFALLAIRFLLSFIQSHTFIPFGIYRILLAIVYASLLLK
ncbi:MAG: undecaprenyl-diphosphatase [Patescibacteria group bacterium]|nr:MAG: undecaprenyl-diphosphatase [Patescibacteria group bacterium]